MYHIAFAAYTGSCNAACHCIAGIRASETPEIVEIAEIAGMHVLQML